MRIDFGTRIRSSDGEELGAIERVVVDPATGQIKAAVVSKGLLSENVEIPVETMLPDDEEGIRLALSSRETGQLPLFVEGRYTSSPAGFSSPVDFSPAGILWPRVYPADEPLADQIESLHTKDSLENAVIARGAEVVGRDGEKLGEVEQITFDAQSGRPTSVVIGKRRIFSEDTEVPGSAVASIDDGVVYLHVASDYWENTAEQAKL